MQRPTPLLPTVTTPISLWPYKSWVKGNLNRGEKRDWNEGGTQHKQRKNREQDREKTEQDRGGGTQKNTRKKNKKTELHAKNKKKKAAYTPTRIVPAIVVSLQQEKQKKTQKLTSTVNRRLHYWFFHLKSAGGEDQIVGTGAKGRAKGKRREAPLFSTFLLCFQKQVRRPHPF